MALFRKLLGVPKAASVGKRKGRAFVAPPGQQAYTTGGTYSFVAPAGVTSVSVVAVGIGAGGSGSEHTIVVAHAGGKACAAAKLSGSIQLFQGGWFAFLLAARC